jgi:tetratricopeptide (TPR) repeat protein
VQRSQQWLFLNSVLASLLWVIPAAAAQQDYQTALQEYNGRKYTAAAEHFNLAWRADPNNVSACYYAGYCYYLSGKREQAIDTFWKLVRAFPSRKEAVSALDMLKRIDSEYSKHATEALSSSQSADANGGHAAARPAAENISAEALVAGLIQVKRSTGKLPNVSSGFVDQIKTMLTSLPKPILLLLRNGGCHVCISPSVVESDYRIQNTTPRGWSESSWKNSPAMFDGQDVVISENQADMRTGEYVSTANETGVVRHETGHAVDHCFRYFSKTEEFKHAYFMDRGAIPEAVRTKLEYFLQSDEAGPSEVFAELCCYKFGGETDDYRKELCELVHKYFPLCSQAQDKRLKQIGM